jgi:mono/diheme cytochrome c family protein
MIRIVVPLALLAVLAACREEQPAHLRIADGDAARGREVVARIGCGVCHAVPGVAGARGRVGPPLEGFGARSFIAGTIPNRPDLLMRFVRDAPSLAPATAMPDLPLSEAEARDVAAFLLTLR